MSRPNRTSLGLSTKVKNRVDIFRLQIAGMCELETTHSELIDSLVTVGKNHMDEVVQARKLAATPGNPAETPEN